MQQTVIEAETRAERGKNQARRTRRGGRVPGVLYGVGQEAVPLRLNPKEILSVLRSQTGRNSVFQVHVQEGERSPAMIVDTQFDPVKGSLLHVDLKRIAMTQKLRVSVPLVPMGEAKRFKAEGGVLEFVLREVEIECFPADIPDKFEIGIDELNIGDHVRIADLQTGVGEKIKVLSDPDAVICHIITIRAEEPKPAVEEAVAEGTAEPEVIKKGKAAEEGTEAGEPKKAESKKAESKEK